MPLHAHTPNQVGHWHELESHLRETSRRATRFARSQDAGIAKVLALFHDIGKAHPKFQFYLEAAVQKAPADKCPHAIWGAALLYLFVRKAHPNLWPEVALPILGHHAGLHAMADAEQKIIAHLNLHRKTEIWKGIRGFAASLASEFHFTAQSRGDLLQREFRLRMIFSSLVDADYLDTESHFSPGNSALRGSWTPLSSLWVIFRANHLRLMWFRRGERMSRARRTVYFESRRSARLAPGVFRLTVPTGGGKTRASLAFALRHAVAHPDHGFRRVIVALPYTSIIDQTAAEYRSIFGEPHVLEHHSQVAEEPNNENDLGAQRRALAAENWDSPIIVTTTVQLFESLFANHPSRCRKLHNIANSILILDEVQTLPTELLRPTFNVIKLLTDHYGVTVVFCTATQPAIDKSPYLQEWHGSQITEIVPSYENLFHGLNRVRYKAPRDYADSVLADELCMSANDSVLAIFNTRKDALRIYELMLEEKPEGLYHLSTLLCSHHRRAILKQIRHRLSDELPVRLISTQVVEAGVDLDFPCVYRVVGPLDRIVQAAGRCNREFRLGIGGGRVVLLTLIDGCAPQGHYARGLEIANQLLAEPDVSDRLSGTGIFEDYFIRLYRNVDLDAKKIDSLRSALNYPEVSRNYRFIEPTEQFVVASYDFAIIDPLITAHRFAPSRATWRSLQPYTVSLMKWEADKLAEGNAEEISPRLWRWNGAYDRKTHRGLRAEYDPADLIASKP